MRKQILKIRNYFLALIGIISMFGFGMVANASVSGQYDYGDYVLACSLSYYPEASLTSADKTIMY